MEKDRAVDLATGAFHTILKLMDADENFHCLVGTFVNGDKDAREVVHGIIGWSLNADEGGE